MFTPTLKTIAELKALNDKKLVNVGMYYQRGYIAAWLKSDRRDALLDSIMRGWNIQAMHITTCDDGMIKLDDGKQRFNVICDILSSSYVPQTGDFAGRTFAMWTDEEKAKFLNYPVLMVAYADAEMDDGEKVTYFTRLQKGITLTPTQARRGEYIRKMRVLEILDSPLLTITRDEKPVLTDSEKENLVIQLYELATQESPEFKSAGMIDRFIALGIDPKITKAIKAKMTNLEKVIIEWRTDSEHAAGLKRMLKKTHLPILAHCMPSSPMKQAEIDATESKLCRFFEMSRTDRSESRKLYDEKSSKDTAGKDSIAQRLGIIRSTLGEQTENGKSKLPSSEEKKLADLEHMKEEQAKFDAANAPQEAPTQTSAFLKRKAKQAKAKKPRNAHILTEY